MSHSAKMISSLKTTYRRFQTFIADTGAVAAVEFALILPLMLTLYIGSVETSRALAFDRRLTSAASSLGDLVAQTKDSMTEAELVEFFHAAVLTFAPYTPNGMRQIVTCVHIDNDGNAIVVWSRDYNGGVAHSVDEVIDLPSEFDAIVSADSYVIVSEAAMTYQPITDFIFKNGIELSKEYYYIPRYGGAITIEPA